MIKYKVNETNINTIIRLLPRYSGVYAFASNTGRFLYIGQTTNLMSRIRGHKYGLLKKLAYGKAGCYILTSKCEENKLIEMERFLIGKHMPQFNTVEIKSNGKDRSCFKIDISLSRANMYALQDIREQQDISTEDLLEEAIALTIKRHEKVAA